MDYQPPPFFSRGPAPLVRLGFFACLAVLLMVLGADISLGGEHRGPVNTIAAADMVTAFSYVFGAAAAMIACAALCMTLMEEKPLAGPATPVEMAE